MFIKKKIKKEKCIKNQDYGMKKYKLMEGDNIESLKKIPDNSIDSVVTDPPYGLSFMQKKWDYDVPSVEFWKEVYRVLKPGGHVVSFGGTRTYHRMVVNMEDGGFEIRDQIMWLYASGFPKSHNIGKAVDKLQGNERKVVGEMKGAGSIGSTYISGQEYDDNLNKGVFKSSYTGTKGTSPYEGWGTALKPANEPICVARKPLSEKTIAKNVLKWGTGGINIDGCRIGTETIMTNMKNTKGGLYNLDNKNRTNEVENTFNEGRFPANIILECICDEVIKGEKGEVIKKKRDRKYETGDEVWTGVSTKQIEAIDNYNDKGDIHTNPECPCRLLDEQSGMSKSGKPRVRKGGGVIFESGGYDKEEEYFCNTEYGDKGGASRFFYQAKVSKKERNMGLDGFEIEINIGTIKLLIYKEKREIIWEKQDRKVKHQEDMELLVKKDIEEYIKMGDYVWNIELFGNYIMERFQKDFKSIIKTKTNSTIIYQTLCSWIHLITKEYITTQLNEKMVGIKYVENVELKNTKIYITNQKKDGLNQSVENVSSKEVLSINKKGEEIKSSHPTMKPVNLMAYLCRLITPPGGIVLDPFIGSGSTGIAARLEGFRFVGMEMDPEYIKIADARIKDFEKYREFIK